jgi:hypothetical protein
VWVFSLEVCPVRCVVVVVVVVVVVAVMWVLAALALG